MVYLQLVVGGERYLARLARTVFSRSMLGNHKDGKTKTFVAVDLHVIELSNDGWVEGSENYVAVVV